MSCRRGAYRVKRFSDLNPPSVKSADALRGTDVPRALLPGDNSLVNEAPVT